MSYRDTCPGNSMVKMHAIQTLPYIAYFDFIIVEKQGYFLRLASRVLDLLRGSMGKLERNMATFMNHAAAHATRRRQI